MRRRSTYALLGALTAGLLAGPLPALASPPAPPPGPRSLDDGCPAHVVAEDGFTDVPEDGAHEAAVDCVVHWRVANGLSPSAYGPVATVTRAQMASFIARLIDATDGDLPVSDVDHFADDAGSAHAGNIDRLAAAGIVSGRMPGVYDPDAGVTRAQMAAFLTRAYDFRARQQGAAGLAAGPDAFRDDDGNALEAAIDSAAAAGLAGGYDDGSFRPGGLVQRDQMASFLARVLDLVVEEGMARVPGTEPTEPEPAEPEPAEPEPAEPETPADPGNSKNCGDYGSWREAQEWFERYRRFYGDVANLDPDSNLVACEHLHDAPGSLAMRASGRRVVDIVQVHWTQPDEQQLSSLVDTLQSADAHLTGLTRGNVDLVLGKATGWVTIPAPAEPCDRWDIMRKAVAATGFEARPERHLVIYFPQDDACTSRAWGARPGSHVWLNGTDDVGTLVHELLHNVGLHHADAVYCYDTQSIISVVDVGSLV